MDAELERLLRVIVRQCDPVEVILFGSHARGDASLDSDLDLLVVMPDGTHRRDATGRIYQALAHVPDRIRAVDVVVTTPWLRDRERGLDGSVVSAAERDGRSIYRRPEPVHA